MRYLKRFEYAEPSTLDEAVVLLKNSKGEAKVLAGGTDLLVKMKGKTLTPKCLINLKKIHTPDLRSVTVTAKGDVSIGCLATLESLQDSVLIRDTAKVLSDTAQRMASPQVRTIATLGGNLCNAAPSADMAPPLIAIDAEVKLYGPRGERFVKLEDFFLNPGQTALQEGEILAEVIIPQISPGSRTTYQKLTLREAMDIATVGVASTLKMKNRRCEVAKIVLGAVAPRPLRALKAEKLLMENELSENLVYQAARTAAAESQPISDIRGSEDYRREMVEVLVRRVIQAVV